MSTYSVREVVDLALNTEKLGYKFYTEMAEKFKEHEGLKDLFTHLATMELKHERIFSDLLKKITDAEPEGWDEAQGYFRAMVESEFFLGNNKALQGMDKVSTVIEATDFAIGFEKETTLFFVGMRQAVKEKEVIDEIIAEELSHLAWLRKFRETL